MSGSALPALPPVTAELNLQLTSRLEPAPPFMSRTKTSLLPVLESTKPAITSGAVEVNATQRPSLLIAG